MRRLLLIAFLAILCLCLSWVISCMIAGGGGDSDDDTADDDTGDDDTLEEASGYEWELNEDDFNDATGVETPEHWSFLFAINFKEDEVEVLENDFQVDLTVLEDLGLLPPVIEYQAVFAKADLTPAGQPGLRFTNKVLIQDGLLSIDAESQDLLGDSIGPSGAGWYACYIAEDLFGFIKGTVTDCGGNAPGTDSILVTASDGPFFTWAADGGFWALPSLSGKPAMINFDAGDCAGSDAEPVTDTIEDPNPKDPGETPPSDRFDDDPSTVVVDGGETDLSGNAGVNIPPASDDLNLDFESGTTGWEGPADCFMVIDTDYAALFPSGDEANYAFITTGGNGRKSCTVARSVTVPEGATRLVVSYDYVSQEYPEWINSAYNDMFTIILSGETSYLVHRTITDGAAPGAWIDYGQPLGNIAESADAQYNSNGSVFDGQITPDNINGEGEPPRGGNDDTKVYGRTAIYAVTPGFTITILITVADVADVIYDSAALIDYFRFQ